MFIEMPDLCLLALAHGSLCNIFKPRMRYVG